eukprot:jgi/Astpho2/9690/Aster-03682
MSTTVLEQTRGAHEELEHLERLIVKDFRNELKGHKERLHQNHRVRTRLDAMQEQAKKLVEIYRDEDKARQEDIASLKVTDEAFAGFYERVKDLREYHKKHSTYDVTEAPNDEALLKQEPRIEFSGEEGYGRYLDLHEPYHTFINSKFGRQMEYAEYVRTLMAWSEVLRPHRLNKPYRDYLQSLLAYLEGFHERVSPLSNLGATYQRLQQEFEEAWETGQLAGWEDRGIGKANGEHQAPVVDLMAFDTVEELETLGADTLKSALQALGLKCGGTLRQRAERLMLTKTTPLEQLDQKLFVKGAAPQAALSQQQRIRQSAAAKETALLEIKISTLCGDKNLLGRVLEDTQGNIEKKQARSYEEMLAEQEEAEQEAGASDSDEEDDFIYNPLKLPLGWDGKPIPYWLYKLHGLNQEFTCEICGSQKYWGRRAFERHFREQRHQHGMRALGIPNTKNFYEVTQIEDAQRLWKNIQDREKPGHKIEVDEEFEDAEGNVKCARVVGEVLGKYHPHGDTSVYDALVRLAQAFSMRAPLIQGHGNFGSVDNDPPAAMRYTECRLEAFSMANYLADLEADTVDYSPNFDNSQEEPSVLPSRVPALLVNGSSGIAVGIATKIPPHNLQEVVHALGALIKDPNITVAQLMQHIPGPDFPTGGELLLSDGVRTAYQEGKGSITVRGTAHIEDEMRAPPAKSGGKRKGSAAKSRTGAQKPLVIITELPYQVNKADLVESIARLVDAGTLTGISDVRDESDREGMRIVVEVRRTTGPDVVLNNLFKHTSLQGRFPCNMVALVHGNPVSLTLKQFLQHFLGFRCQVVERRARFACEGAKKRLHLVEGFLKAMAALDGVIKVIRGAQDSADASAQLQQGFNLSSEQAEGVLNMSLRRLTSLEAQKLEDEAQKLRDRITDLEDLLQQRGRVLQMVHEEAQEVAQKFGTPRRTAIAETGSATQLSNEDLIPNQPSLILFSRRGYIKRMPGNTFAVQHRQIGAKLKGNDVVEDVLHVMDHDHVLFFTADGVARSIRAHQIPPASRTALGTAITQVLPIKKDDVIAAMLPVSDFPKDKFLVLCTEKGVVKKTPLSAFADVRSSGIAAIKLKKGDQLLWVGTCTSGCSIVLASSGGRAIHFCADDDQIRPLGRAAAGIQGIKLGRGERVVGMSMLPAGTGQAEDVSSSGDEDEHAERGEDAGGAALQAGPWLALVTERGIGKRLPVAALPLQQRAGTGRIAIKFKEGDTLAALHVVGLTSNVEDEELLLGTSNGQLTRISLKDVAVRSGRATRGVQLIRLAGVDKLVAVTPLQQRLADVSLEDTTEASINGSEAVKLPAVSAA